jgi:hypothetical protein
MMVLKSNIYEEFSYSISSPIVGFVHVPKERRRNVRLVGSLFLIIRYLYNCDQLIVQNICNFPVMIALLSRKWSSSLWGYSSTSHEVNSINFSLAGGKKVRSRKTFWRTRATIRSHRWRLYLVSSREKTRDQARMINQPNSTVINV